VAGGRVRGDGGVPIALARAGGGERTARRRRVGVQGPARRLDPGRRGAGRTGGSVDRDRRMEDGCGWDRDGGAGCWGGSDGWRMGAGGHGPGPRVGVRLGSRAMGG